jgi:hypothetical protein
LWRHFPKISDRLFSNVSAWSAFIMDSFSSLHKYIGCWMFQNRPIDGKSLLFKFKFAYILRQFSFFLITNKIIWFLMVAVSFFKWICSFCCHAYVFFIQTVIQRCYNSFVYDTLS